MPETKKTDLTTLAKRINTAHGMGVSARKKGLGHYRACGEWLLEAKKKCGHGEWGKWMKASLKFTEQTATRYMRFAEQAKTKTVFDLEELEELWDSTRPTADTNGKAAKEKKAKTSAEPSANGEAGEASNTDERLVNFGIGGFLTLTVKKQKELDDALECLHEHKQHPARLMYEAILAAAKKLGGGSCRRLSA